MEYPKKHLSFDQQVDRLREHGLAIADERHARALLASVGYYRLSAYIYPFRETLDSISPTTGQNERGKVRPGVTIEHVEEIWKFDRFMRQLVLTASETIEVGLRTQIAYVLGRRDRFGHVNREALDPEACSRMLSIRGEEIEAYEVWMERYEKLKKDAQYEDYVKHNETKYHASPLAVWVATEFLDFGAAVRLLGLLKIEDSNEIAKAMGMSTGKKLHTLVLACSDARNTAAHHNRLWNRTPRKRLPKLHTREVSSELQHWDEVDHGSVYGLLTAMAYLVKRISPDDRWPIHLRERVQKFPKVPYLTAENSMGFAPGWSDLELWRHS
ncbi:Abi family protein [Micrococcus terreus]|uniref:Abi family protein n=1 Tax=Micrococcus terreus TaxID=574650 RepID=UPI00340EFD61